MKILTLKQKILLGVHLVYVMRKLKAPFVLESAVFAILALVLELFVSIPNVVSNMLESGNFARYFLVAFSNTTFLVQLLVFLTGMTLIFSLRNFGTILELSRSSSVGRAPLS